MINLLFGFFVFINLASPLALDNQQTGKSRLILKYYILLFSLSEVLHKIPCKTANGQEVKVCHNISANNNNNNNNNFDSGENNPAIFSGKTEKLFPSRDSADVCVWRREIGFGDMAGSKKDYILDHHKVRRSKVASFLVKVSQELQNFEIELRNIGANSETDFEKRSLGSKSELGVKCLHRKIVFNNFPSSGGDEMLFFSNSSAFFLGENNNNRICSVEIEGPSDKRFALSISIMRATAAQKTIKGKLSTQTYVLLLYSEGLMLIREL